MYKDFLTMRVRKYALKELAFTKSKFLAFIKSNFLDLAIFGFLDLINFLPIDRFSTSLSIVPLPSLLLIILPIS